LDTSPRSDAILERDLSASNPLEVSVHLLKVATEPTAPAGPWASLGIGGRIDEKLDAAGPQDADVFRDGAAVQRSQRHDELRLATFIEGVQKAAVLSELIG